MPTRRSAMFKEEEWARVQPTIRKLYLLEDRSLKDVMTILSTLHNFRPSKAQLESKLKQWHMTKNMKSAAWKYVHMSIRKRRHHGKESKVYLSGIPLPPETVEKARSHHFKSTLDRVTGKAPPSPEDLSLIIRTPSPPAEVQIWNTRNIPWLLATNFFREFNFRTLLQSRLSIRFPVEELLSLVLKNHPKLSSHTSKLQYTVQSLALIVPATHQEHHISHAESLLLPPLSASITSESFQLMLLLLANNFLRNGFSNEDREKQSAITGWLLDTMQRSRVLDLLKTQSFATLPLSLQSALNRIFHKAVKRSELNLVRQLLQVGVDVNQLLWAGFYHFGYLVPHRAFEYAVLVHDT
ncbi:hypothetical protein CTA1_656 [Colletotrichum tanaceti]|uniref:Clr5 domain-containing protein n=1 Tax=Colletotrichum tanaceti TaxID=1306861 RepID=A0A4U6X2J3_9PEZI|nr:hypothetical protein CTA1_656 [Colletotrichum tanaceti]